MGKISLLLDRGADPRYRVQDFSSCLHYAILGSCEESPEGLRDSLILLIKKGADVYSRDTRGRSVSDIACEPKTEWCIEPFSRQDGRDQLFSSRNNSDLRLQAIWAEALTACGYNAEEVMSSSIRVKESSESDDNVSENKDNVASQEEDDVITQGQDDELSLNDRVSPGSSDTF